jgi:hypothetical protein
MARTTTEIYDAIVAAKEADANLNGLTSNSQTSIWRLWAFITAAAINLFEQIQDAFKVEIENIAKTIVPGTPSWLRQKTLEFQYSATSPQNLILVDLVPTYPVIDESLRIITRASVTETTNLTVNVKVAKNDPPVPLSVLEENSLIDYLGTIRFAGTNINVVNSLPDRLYINANIYYDGAYSSVIEANVKTALGTYLQNLSSFENFNGVVRNTAIVDTIQSVEGVTDVLLNQSRGRAEATPFSGGTVIVLKYETFAGYVIEEDTAGNTFDDTLTFILEQ